MRFLEMPGVGLRIGFRRQQQRFSSGHAVRLRNNSLHSQAVAKQKRSPVHPEAFGAPVEKSVSYNGGASIRKSLDVLGKRPNKTPAEEPVKR